MPPPPSHGHRTTSGLPVAFLRARDQQVVAGVASGLGHHIGVDPLVIRVAVVVLTLAGGAGLVLYGAGWLLSRDPIEGVPGDQPASFDARQTFAVGFVALGLTLLLRGLGIWFADVLVWPPLFAGAISAVIWTRSSPSAARSRLTEPTLVRTIVAAVLTLVGVIAFWTAVPNPTRVVMPLLGIVIGMGLLVLPFLARLWHNLEAERSQRARSIAREEVAAHLHDSVLQTLALIQRTDQPRRAVTLARTQERELRAWLYGAREMGNPARGLGAAVDEVVTEVETAYDIKVDHVVVGNIPNVDQDPNLSALLAAVREGLVNSAKHADVRTASLYVEVEPERVTAFVRDRGSGFDPGAVASDRHGLRDSIHERLARHDGGARVTTTIGEGTEVEAWVAPSTRLANEGDVDDDSARHVTTEARPRAIPNSDRPRSGPSPDINPPSHAPSTS